jgi:hypothetical protein
MNEGQCKITLSPPLSRKREREPAEFAACEAAHFGIMPADATVTE